MPKTKSKGLPYIYQRSARSGCRTTWYGDFRRFKDVGGALERLAPYADGFDVVDEDTARAAYGVREAHYVRLRAQRARSGGDPVVVSAVAARTAPDGAGGRSPTGIADRAFAATRGAAPDAGVADQVVRALMEAITAAGPTSRSSAGADITGDSLARLTLGEAVEDHLRRKRTARRQKESTCDRDATALANVRRLLGDSRLLESVTSEDLAVYVTTRLAEPGHRAGTTVAVNTILNELHALSNVYTRLAKRLDRPVVNPVRRMDKPGAGDPDENPLESGYLQRREAAALLDAAAELDFETNRAREAMRLVQRARAMCTRGRSRPDAAQRLLDEAESLYPAATRAPLAWHRRVPFAEALLTTYLHTGGRLDEVLGLDLADLDWSRREVVFRKNRWRGLKRSHCARRVPMGPELERVLRHHLAVHAIETGLVFPSGTDAKMHDIQTTFVRCLDRAGLRASDQWSNGGDLTRRLTTHACRHTYATALLHTSTEVRREADADGSERIERAQRSAWDVARRLGHKRSNLVDEVYGHLHWEDGVRDEVAFDDLRRLPTTRAQLHTQEVTSRVSVRDATSARLNSELPGDP